MLHVSRISFSMVRIITLVVSLITFVMCVTNQAVLAQCDWEEAQKLLVQDGSLGDQLGWSVSISGDIAVIGAYRDDDKGSDSGSAYIYRWDGSNWIEEQKLLASDGAADDYFGYSVSISGDVAVIGAHGDNDSGNDSGSAYIYRWDHGGLVWTEEQKLHASDGAPSDFFGRTVSISSDVVVIGSPGDDDNGVNSGSAYLYRWNPNNMVWLQEQKLLASDGAENDHLGETSVSISGDIVVLGAYGDDEVYNDSGSAYIFRWNVNQQTWLQEKKLQATDGAADDYFGWSVSVSGDLVVIGAYGDDDNDFNSGSSYIFRWDPDIMNWIEEQKLLATDGKSQDYFGESVSISNDVIVIGVSQDSDNGFYTGSAYIFRWDPDIMLWIEEQELHASDCAATDYFGRSVSISGDITLIGSWSDDDKGDDSGSVYVFDFPDGFEIFQQPHDQIIARSNQACFYVLVEGGVGDINYQWRRDGDNLVDGGTISGSNTDTLCIDPAWSGDEGLYDVVITDDCGQVISEPAELIVIDPLLYVDGTCPQGGAITINWTDAYPAGQIALLFAAETGNFRIPGSFQCAGIRLGLGNRAIQLGYKGYAGDDGSREIHASAGPNACSGYLQLIDMETCVVSNVVQIE